MDNDFDVDAFLQKPLFAHLATASGDGPRESPVWFLWEAGALWLVGTNRDSFPKRLRAEPRCAVGIVEFDLPNGLLRHVGIRGTATIEQLDHRRKSINTMSEFSCTRSYRISLPSGEISKPRTE